MMSQPTHYNAKFFEAISEGSLRSARAVVPVILELTKAKSVIDFGCGTGAWLRAFSENGIEDFLGIDGSYVDRSHLQIDASRFKEHNLANPIVLERRYDLAICLEVAEHLPTRTSRNLVRSLASAAPAVLFSAAIPGQGGTNHINEQWPEFWGRLFAEQGFRKLDLIRSQIISNSEIEWWYRQNLFMYVVSSVPGIPQPAMENHKCSLGNQLEVIDPNILGQYKTFKGLIRATLAAGYRTLKNRIIITR